MMPQPTKSRKPAYKPHVQKVAANAYTVPSERWGGHILYLVTVAADGRTTCECEAGTRGRTCKHSRLVESLMAYNAKPQHLQPATPRYHDATALLEAFGVN
jgi:hypothetical protein